MRKIVGKKNVFTVEYEIVDKNQLIGYSKIFFNNIPLGTSEDLIFIKGYLINGLEAISNSFYLDIKMEEFNKENVFNYLNDRLSNLEDYGIHKYLISLGTFCDDYTVFSFFNNDSIYVLWRLNSNETPFSDLKRLTIEVNYFELKKISFLRVLQKIKREILS
ncbi:hypothetical protein [Flavobacterium sp.]